MSDPAVNETGKQLVFGSGANPNGVIEAPFGATHTDTSTGTKRQSLGDPGKTWLLNETSLSEKFRETDIKNLNTTLGAAYVAPGVPATLTDDSLDAAIKVLEFPSGSKTSFSKTLWAQKEGSSLLFKMVSRPKGAGGGTVKLNAYFKAIGPASGGPPTPATGWSAAVPLAPINTFTTSTGWITTIHAVGFPFGLSTAYLMQIERDGTTDTLASAWVLAYFGHVSQ